MKRKSKQRRVSAPSQWLCKTHEVIYRGKVCPACELDNLSRSTEQQLAGVRRVLDPDVQHTDKDVEYLARVRMDALGLRRSQRDAVLDTLGRFAKEAKTLADNIRRESPNAVAKGAESLSLQAAHREQQRTIQKMFDENREQHETIKLHQAGLRAVLAEVLAAKDGDNWHDLNEWLAESLTRLIGGVEPAGRKVGTRKT